jgi:tetratricopeptide (TPR) repeat protein
MPRSLSFKATRMRILVFVVVSLFAQLANVPWAGAASANANPALQKGIKEFQAGAFVEALAYFQEAQREGLDTPAVHYNLGATYYRLHRDQQAEAEFRSLLRDPKFGDFSRYNLGLIARRAGRQTEAQQYFSAAASGSTNPHLRALARAQLRSHTRDTSRWYGMLELGGGYDDNVTLTELTSLVTPSGAASSFASAYASGAGRITGNAAEGLWLTGSLRDTKYFKQSAYDLLLAKAGSEYRFSADDWRLRPGANVTHIRLGTAALETLYGLDVRAEHALGSGRLQLDYAVARIDGGQNYQYLTGWQNQLGVHATWQPGAVQIGAGYVLALNRRQDRIAGAEFFSASPRRSQLEADLRWSPTLKTTAYARGSYWRSRYADPNVFLQAGTLVTQRRLDTGRDAELGATYRLGTSMRLGAEYGYRSNDSTITRYTYARHRYSLQFQYFY